MRPLRALAIYIAVVFLGGALLAPWLYWLTQFLAHSFPNACGHFFPELAGKPFHRFIDRALLGLALIGLWPLLKNLGATSLRDIGLVKPAGQWKKLGGGFLLGFLSLAAVAGLAIAAEARHINSTIPPAKLGDRLISAALTAVVVAVLEEILFRGALFGSLRKVFHWVFALVVSSMIYAIVHFLESARDVETVTWLSGLQVLPRMLANFTNWQEVIPGFFNLTLAGMLLGLAYERTGNLYFSIGLHAGWIFWLKSYGALTVSVPGANEWWWGTAKLVNGWAALPALVVALLVFLQLPLAKKPGLRL